MNTSMKFLFRKSNISTILLFKDANFLYSNWQDLLYGLSLGTCDSGTHKIALATSADTGIEPNLLYHQSKASSLSVAQDHTFLILYLKFQHLYFVFIFFQFQHR